LFHDFINWIREDLGRFTPDGQSWSHQLHESLNMWNVIEGTHVLTVMFFAGTIWLIDLRMMGVAFRNMPFSRLNDRVLPITTIAFAVMIITGLLVFLGRDPLMYYHNIWFRLKMVFLIVAAINIFWFHQKVQKSQAEWDAMEKPPTAVRLSGAISMTCWFFVIIFGRFIAYDWFYCEKTEPGSLVYTLQECKQALSYLEEGAGEGTVESGETAEPDTSTDNATPEGDPAETTNPADEPPADGAAPQPAPGQEG
jgi:hypothetical protein